MYFHSRAEAGKKLAPHLEPYKNQPTVVVALSEGASTVAAQIAMHVHSNMVLYLIKDIYLPGEIEAIAGLSSTDTFTYNAIFSAGQIEEMVSEYYHYIEQERINRRHEFNVLLGHEGEIDKNLLRHRNVILVSDGLSSGLSLTVASDYFKTIAIKRFIVATPLASVAAVDRMHLLADEIACLSVLDNYMFTNHYYDDNTVPDVPHILKMMRHISVNWER